jgi:hypothetical protein
MDDLSGGLIRSTYPQNNNYGRQFVFSLLKITKWDQMNGMRIPPKTILFKKKLKTTGYVFADQH